jgi:hypothetical protein
LSKYNARRVKHDVDGEMHTFDSVVERDRYLYLKEKERAGEIDALSIQPSFLLQEQFKRNGKWVRPTIYKADFLYQEDGKAIVEDVKGFCNEIYKLKRKLFLFLNQEMTFREVTKKRGVWDIKEF